MLENPVNVAASDEIERWTKLSAQAKQDAQAWREKYGEEIPATGRPGRKTETPLTERVAVLLTPEELGRVDARRGRRSRSEFLREVISKGLRAR